MSSLLFVIVVIIVTHCRYDVSDEDIEIPSPDHITSIISVRGSSDEDTF